MGTVQREATAHSLILDATQSVIGLMLEPHKKVSSPLLYQLDFIVGLIEGDLLT
jgi:hypothetical protein